MLKRTYLAAMAALALSGAKLDALPVGNPLDATWLCTGVFMEGNCYGDPCCESWCDAWSVRIGYYGDFVFNRRLRVKENHRHKRLRRSEFFTNAGYIAFNVWNKFDVFTSFGATKAYLKTPERAFLLEVAPNNVFNVEIESDFSWSVGVRGTIWECGCFGVGAEAQYFEWKSDINFVDTSFTTPFYLEDGDTRFKEWQVGLGATYKIPICGCGTFVVPYVGVKWAHAKLDMGDFSSTDINGNLFELFNLRSDFDFGYAVGITLVGCNRWSFTAEARFVDETALHINSQVRF
jgi:major outer membrane protein